VIIVEGLLPNGQDHFASELNASLAQALDAEVVLSVQQIFKTRKTAEKVEAHLRQFGGATSNRTAGVLFMRTRGLSEETAQIPVAFDPSLRPTEEIAKFTAELQKYNRYFGSSDLPIIGLVPLVIP
jgi:phosphate acetyltransferase